MVLSDETTSYSSQQTVLSRVRRIDPATGSYSLRYYGHRLDAMTVAPDGTSYVVERGNWAALSGVAVARLGSDGSLTRLAGGGHVTADTQTSDTWFLSAGDGLAPAADGGVFVAEGHSGRVFEVRPGATLTPRHPSPICRSHRSSTLRTAKTPRR